MDTPSPTCPRPTTAPSINPKGITPRPVRAETGTRTTTPGLIAARIRFEDTAIKVHNTRGARWGTTNPVDSRRHRVLAATTVTPVRIGAGAAAEATAGSNDSRRIPLVSSTSQAGWQP